MPESAFFLRTPGLHIAVEVVAPDCGQSEVAKAMADHFVHGSGNEPAPPERHADPL